MIHFSWPITVDTDQLPALSVLSRYHDYHVKVTFYSRDLATRKIRRRTLDYLSHIWSNLWPDRYQLLSILKPRYKISLLSISTPQNRLQYALEPSSENAKKRLSSLEMILASERERGSYSWIKVEVRRKENYASQNRKDQNESKTVWPSGQRRELTPFLKRQAPRNIDLHVSFTTLRCLCVCVCLNLSDRTDKYVAFRLWTMPHCHGSSHDWKWLRV